MLRRPLGTSCLPHPTRQNVLSRIKFLRRVGKERLGEVITIYKRTQWFDKVRKKQLDSTLLAIGWCKLNHNEASLIPIRMSKSEDHEDSNEGTDGKPLDHSSRAGGNVKWCCCPKKHLGNFWKCEHAVTIQPSDGAPSHHHRGIKNLHLHKNLFANILTADLLVKGQSWMWPR